MTKVTDLTKTDILHALTSFCVTFSAPALADEDHVFYGYESNRSLPSDGNDFCVVTPIAQRRVGSNIERWEPSGADEVELCEYVELDVQVDCYSTDSFSALERAQTYEAIARSFSGVDHFLTYGLDCLYADGLQNLTAVLDSSQYVSRWTLTLHLGYWKRLTLQQDFFFATTVDVVNVDTTFKP